MASVAPTPKLHRKKHKPLSLNLALKNGSVRNVKLRNAITCEKTFAAIQRFMEKHPTHNKMLDDKIRALCPLCTGAETVQLNVAAKPEFSEHLIKHHQVAAEPPLVGSTDIRPPTHLSSDETPGGTGSQDVAVPVLESALSKPQRRARFKDAVGLDSALADSAMQKQVEASRQKGLEQAANLVACLVQPDKFLDPQMPTPNVRACTGRETSIFRTSCVEAPVTIPADTPGPPPGLPGVNVFSILPSNTVVVVHFPTSGTLSPGDQPPATAWWSVAQHLWYSSSYDGVVAPPYAWVLYPELVVNLPAYNSGSGIMIDNTVWNPINATQGQVFTTGLATNEIESRRVAGYMRFQAPYLQNQGYSTIAYQSQTGAGGVLGASTVQLLSAVGSPIGGSAFLTSIATMSARANKTEQIISTPDENGALTRYCGPLGATWGFTVPPTFAGISCDSSYVATVGSAFAERSAKRIDASSRAIEKLATLFDRLNRGDTVGPNEARSIIATDQDPLIDTRVGTTPLANTMSTYASTDDSYTLMVISTANSAQASTIIVQTSDLIEFQVAAAMPMQSSSPIDSAYMPDVLEISQKAAWASGPNSFSSFFSDLWGGIKDVGKWVGNNIVPIVETAAKFL